MPHTGQLTEIGRTRALDKPHPPRQDCDDPSGCQYYKLPYTGRIAVDARANNIKNLTWTYCSKSRIFLSV